MKTNSRFLMLVLTIFTVILSACGGTNIPVTGSGSAVQTLPTAFIAVVENITGDQWMISGQTITIDPVVVSGGPFNTGDLVKVDLVVNQDGSFTISSVETPSVEVLSALPRLEGGDVNLNDANANANNNDNANVNINSNDNTTNANLNDNTNSANSNDNDANNVNTNDNTNANNNSNDANSNDDNNDNGNDNNYDNDNRNDNDNSGPGSGGNDNDDSG
jgi:hypothetical protein